MIIIGRQCPCAFESFSGGVKISLQPPNKGTGMNSWFKDIERATSGAELVSRARDYCSLLHPRELAPLPKECREIRIDGESDIVRLRQALSDGYARLDDFDDTQRLRELVDYLSRASQRLGELREFP